MGVKLHDVPHRFHYSFESACLLWGRCTLLCGTSGLTVGSPTLLDFARRYPPWPTSRLTLGINVITARFAPKGRDARPIIVR